MNIAQLINKDAEKYSPYMGGFINHLPMGIFALYAITKDIDKVEDFAEAYGKKITIDKVKEKYKKVNSFKECLGKRELYESCLDLIRESSKDDDDIENLLASILKEYPLGLSSGLFHTTIRLSYAIEGYKLDKNLKAEVERALAYYITAYREGHVFKREIPQKDVLAEMNQLIEDEELKEIRNSRLSLGGKLKKLYSNERFLQEGFIIEGSEEDKVKSLLQILIPAYYNSNSILVLHCITGLQAVVALKNYFDNYLTALDILTTTAIAHLLTQTDLDMTKRDTSLDISWEELMKKVSNSENVHTIKLAYTSKKLDDLFKERNLKYITNKRVDLEN